MEMLLSRENLWKMIPQDRPADNLGGCISLRVDDSQLIHLRWEQTAREMWHAQRKLHEDANLSSTPFLWRSLHTPRLQRHQQMQEHGQFMLKLIQQL